MTGDAIDMTEQESKAGKESEEDKELMESCMRGEEREDEIDNEN